MALISLAQKPRCNYKNFDYTNCEKLYLNFGTKNPKAEKISWDKFENLNAVVIEGYSNDSKPLNGFQTGGFTNLAVNHSDISAFFSKNQLPNSIKKLTIWFDGSFDDSLTVPETIARLVNLTYLSIGCCSHLSFENCNLSGLPNLDTLIIEAPVSNLKFLNGVSKLKYLGFWSPSLSDFKNELDSLMPNTKKEAWCFPGDQAIQMWNGQTKIFKELSIGDTLVSFDFEKEQIVPNIIEQIEKHHSEEYLFGTIQENELLASIASFPVNQNNIFVRATVNHPMMTIEGAKSLGTIRSGMHCFILNSNRKVETRSISGVFFDIQTEEVYNIKTTGDTYFVGNILFMEK